jgi:hypothetical protein
LHDPTPRLTRPKRGVGLLIIPKRANTSRQAMDCTVLWQMQQKIR